MTIIPARCCCVFAATVNGCPAGVLGGTARVIVWLCQVFGGIFVAGGCMQIRPNRIKHKLADGRVCFVLGGVADPDMLDQLGACGADGFWLEGEHGPVDFDNVATAHYASAKTCLRAAGAALPNLKIVDVGDGLREVVLACNMGEGYCSAMLLRVCSDCKWMSRGGAWWHSAGYSLVVSGVCRDLCCVRLYANSSKPY